MFVVLIISLLYLKGSCHRIPVIQPAYSKELINCVTAIVSEYFAPQNVLTYVGNKQYDDEFLKAIHNLNAITILSKKYSGKLPVLHEGYIISAKNYKSFTEYFPTLITESTWNPEARFLVIIKALEYYQLEYIFNSLLKQHVNDVIVVNATSDANIYSYNPFDNYRCGRSFDEIINYGKCTEALTQDLYPDKFVTELRNCTFNVVMPHWPPYTLIPKKGADTSSLLSFGLEPYLLGLVSEMEGFTINILLEKIYNTSYSTISDDMVAAGPLKMLQNNEADIILGGLLLVPTRALAFSYVHDFLPYVDEIRYFVKQASYVPLWKIVYLEFDGTVWMLILLSLVFYSIVMMVLLRVEDKSLLVLKLLDNFVLHGSKIQCRSTGKCVFIIWVWFAYLINAFYQSSLFSLTTHPPKDSQISTEADIMRYNLKPCFSDLMDKYDMESARSRGTYDAIPGCQGSIESVKMVMNSKDYYTIFLYGLFRYHRSEFTNSFGKMQVYALKKPYSKVIYSMFFFKGFPQMHDLHYSALRVREMGFVSKALSNIKNSHLSKLHYRSRSYKPRFVLPWRVYIFGCSIATITLIVEILSKLKY